MGALIYKTDMKDSPTRRLRQETAPAVRALPAASAPDAVLRRRAMARRAHAHSSPLNKSILATGDLSHGLLCLSGIQRVGPDVAFDRLGDKVANGQLLAHALAHLS